MIMFYMGFIVFVCCREAGCTPFAASILTDYFPAETRGLALGIYNFGIYFGYSLAYAFGNFVSLANINGQVIRLFHPLCLCILEPTHQS